MKKIIILLVTVFLLLTGCKSKYEPDFQLLSIIQSALMNELNTRGYNESSQYILEGPYTSEGNEFPRIYVLKVDGKEVSCILCNYSVEVGYGGINYPYKDGYVTCLIHSDVLQMKDGWKSERAEVKVNEWFFNVQNVVIEENDKKLSDDDIQLITNMFQGGALGYADLLKNGDEIGIHGPLIHYFTKYVSTEDTIELIQQDFCELILTVNGEPFFYMTFNPADKSVGLTTLEPDYQANIINALKNNKSFILMPMDVVITADSEYDPNLLPVLARKASKTVIEKAKTIPPYECIASFNFVLEP